MRHCHYREIGCGYSARRNLAAALAVILTGCNQKTVNFAGNSADVKAAIVINEMKFPAALINEDRLEYQPAFGTVKETLTLKQKPLQTLSLRQVERPTKTELYTQGHPGSVTIRDYPISSSAELDLIVVVDNSSSMAAVQAMLAEGMRDFIDNLHDIDWRIGVITSDNPSNINLRNADGCQLYGTDGRPGGQPIMKSDPDASRKFLNTVINIGARGSDYEESILNTYKHISGTCAYGSNSWLRPNAMLGVLFVSDEDSFCPEPIDPVTGLPTRPKDSDSELCGTGQRPADLAAMMMPPHREAGSARIYSLTWRSQDSQCFSNAQRPANRILELISLVGGFDNSICQSSYSETLGAIAQDAARIVRRNFQLPQVPIENTVVVTIDGVPTTDYRIEGSMLILNHVTAEQRVLHISYRHDPVPIFSSITLTDSPDPTTMAIEVNGNLLDQSGYNFNASTRQLDFTETPPGYAHVMITYKQAGGLRNSFDVAADEMDEDPVSVKVDDVDTLEFQFDRTNGSLNFPRPPKDGSVINVSYRPKNSKITRYEAYKHPSGFDPLLVNAIDAATGEEVDVKISGSQLVLDAAMVLDGRSLIVTYNYGDTTTPLTYKLAYQPLDGRVEVHSSSDQGDCVSNLVIWQDIVTFSCKATTLNSVNVSYQYVVEHYSTFTLNKPIPDLAFVQVFVDGVQVDKFKVDGQAVNLPISETKPTSTVRVLVLTRIHD